MPERRVSFMALVSYYFIYIGLVPVQGEAIRM